VPLCAGMPKRAGAVSDEDEPEGAATAAAATCSCHSDKTHNFIQYFSVPLCSGVPKRAGAVSDEDELEDSAAADAAAANSAAGAAADPSQPPTDGGQSGPPPGTPSAAQRSRLGGTADSPQGGQPQRPSDGVLRRWSWMDGDDGAREVTQSGVDIAQEGQVFISCTDSQTSYTDCKYADDS